VASFLSSRLQSSADLPRVLSFIPPQPRSSNSKRVIKVVQLSFPAFTATPPLLIVALAFIAFVDSGYGILCSDWVSPSPLRGCVVSPPPPGNVGVVFFVPYEARELAFPSRWSFPHCLFF